MSSINEAQIREALIHAAHRLDALGLVPATGGNLSARIAEDTILITRTHVRKRHLRVEDLVTVSLDGAPHSGGRASSEMGLHLTVYRARPEVAAVVHAHPPTACAFAVAGLNLTQPLMPEAVVGLGEVPLTPYATPGTKSMEEAILPAAREHDAFLLANHGAVTTGKTVDEALDRMETLEHLAKVTAVAKFLGGAQVLSPEHLRALLEIRHTLR